LIQLIYIRSNQCCCLKCLEAGGCGFGVEPNRAVLHSPKQTGMVERRIQALQAAALIATNIDELNQFLSHDLLEPIRFGIGIHGGEVIIGNIGYRDHQVFTALGDAVNVAARLQDMTKDLECEVILSEEVYKTAVYRLACCQSKNYRSADARCP